MKKLFEPKYFILILLIIAVSCGFKKNNFENYKETINDTLNSLNGKIKEQQDIYDVRDMKGCGSIIELSKWDRYKMQDGKINWGRNRNFRELSGIISYSGFSLDNKAMPKTEILNSDPLYHLIYIGPWHFSKTIGKEIRFYSYTGKGGGYIMYQYESQNEKNKNIPEKKFSLPAKLNIPPDKFGLCVTKWIANYGYNAISEVKSKNPFSKNYLVPTGKIIEVEE